MALEALLALADLPFRVRVRDNFDHPLLIATGECGQNRYVISHDAEGDPFGVWSVWYERAAGEAYHQLGKDDGGHSTSITHESVETALCACLWHVKTNEWPDYSLRAKPEGRAACEKIARRVPPSCLYVAPQASTEAKLESFLTNLVHRLPDATWARIYLPVLPDGKRYHAEAVALLEADVYRLPDTLPDNTPSKTVIIQGRWMTVEEAQPVIKALRLEPVYVLMKRSATTASLVEIGQDQRLSIISITVDGVTFTVSFLPPRPKIYRSLTPDFPTTIPAPEP